MTQQETAQVLTLLRAAYPAFYRKTTAQEAEIAVRLWAEMFAEDDYGIVQYALKQLIADHSGYPPDIAALKTKIKEVIQAADDPGGGQVMANKYINIANLYKRMPVLTDTNGDHLIAVSDLRTAIALAAAETGEVHPIPCKIGDKVYVVLYDVIRHIEDAPTADVAPRADWISVEERWPSSEDLERSQFHNFLVANEFGEVREAVFTGKYFAKLGSRLSGVTHWMPLPEPPVTKGA